MQQRIGYNEVSKGFLDGLMTTAGYLRKSGLDAKLAELINYRISQINGCAYCLDMHHKDAIHLGETEQRLHSLAAWRECPYYIDMERAALAYAEAVNAGEVTDELFNALKPFFSISEIADLTLAVATVATFNRLNKAFCVTPGGYKPGMHG